MLSWGEYSFSGRAAGTQAVRERTLTATVTGPGAVLLGALGYRASDEIAIGGYFDIGLLFAHAQLAQTTFNGTYNASGGGAMAFAVGRGVFATGTFGLCASRVLFDKDDSSDDRYNFVVPEPMSGPTASLALAWFGGSGGVELRASHTLVLGQTSRLATTTLGINASLQRW